MFSEWVGPLSGLGGVVMGVAVTYRLAERRRNRDVALEAVRWKQEVSDRLARIEDQMIPPPRGAFPNRRRRKDPS